MLGNHFIPFHGNIYKCAKCKITGCDVCRESWADRKTEGLNKCRYCGARNVYALRALDHEQIVQ